MIYHGGVSHADNTLPRNKEVQMQRKLKLPILKLLNIRTKPVKLYNIYIFIVEGALLDLI